MGEGCSSDLTKFSNGDKQGHRADTDSMSSKPCSGKQVVGDAMDCLRNVTE